MPCMIPKRRLFGWGVTDFSAGLKQQRGTLRLFQPPGADYILLRQCHDHQSLLACQSFQKAQTWQSPIATRICFVLLRTAEKILLGLAMHRLPLVMRTHAAVHDTPLVMTDWIIAMAIHSVLTPSSSKALELLRALAALSNFAMPCESGSGEKRCRSAIGIMLISSPLNLKARSS